MMTNRPAFRIGCLIFAATTLTVTPSFAQTQEPAGATAAAGVISSVRVEGTGRLEVRASRMQNPERLVLDFSSTRLATQKSVIPGVAAPVRGVRLGQFRPDVARVVVDLTAAAPYQILREGPAVVISFDMQPESPVDAPVATTTIASQDVAQQRPNFHYDLSAPRLLPVRTSKKVSNRVPRFALPGELTQPSFVLASFSAKDEPARPVAAQEAAQQAMAQAGNAAATVAATPQAAAPAAPSRYTGEPISVN
jgi:hypothetical protein